MPADHPRLARAVRLAAGTVFLIAGAAKFAVHGAETTAFTRYGLPFPGAFVAMIGLVELGGGVVLVLGGPRLREACLLLAATMIGAILVSGIGEGEVVPSLTLAPVLLVATVWLASAARSGTGGRPAAGPAGPHA